MKLVTKGNSLKNKKKSIKTPFSCFRILDFKTKFKSQVVQDEVMKRASLKTEQITKSNGSVIFQSQNLNLDYDRDDLYDQMIITLLSDRLFIEHYDSIIEAGKNYTKINRERLESLKKDKKVKKRLIKRKVKK